MFSLQSDKPVTREIRLVVRDRLDSALDLLAENENLLPAVVHQLRKDFKRLKAIFRLVRTVDEAAGTQEIIRYRDLGRQLSSSRDRDVIEQTLVKLQFLTDDETVINRLDNLLQRLQKHSVTETSSPSKGDNDALRKQLLEARTAAENLLRGTYSRNGLIEGYLQTYRKSRNLWKQLPASRQQEDWHDWRKRVKDDWYQTQLLKNFRDDNTKKRLIKLSELADLLGYDHDLENLSEMIETLTVRPHPVDEEVQLLIEKQRQGLQEECLKIGRKLYQDKSKHVQKLFS